MSLKRTSEVITISTRADQGTPLAFAVNQIDLQLNPLDQEVFVVTGIKIDFLSQTPHVLLPVAQGWYEATGEVAITTTRPLSMPNLGDSNVLAYANRQTTAWYDGTNITSMVENETGPADTPDTNLDYIGIIATSDMFLAQDTDGSTGVQNVAIRVYGYRAKADAATYAALVQSEVLSS